MDSSFLSSLNPVQYQAVCHTEGPLLVLAGAGTGKTKVLTSRIAYIIANGLAYSNEILAVTFTNKAALEMRERIHALTGLPLDTHRGWVGTFHSIAVRILRRHAELVGLKPQFTILDPDDCMRVIKQLFKDNGLDEKKLSFKQFDSFLSRFKDQALTSTTLSPSLIDHDQSSLILSLYQQYQQKLLLSNAVDFGDLLLHCLVIFQNHPDVLASWQRQFKYILVDEYQDTNVVQYLFLKLLASLHHNICCVGDDDQSIYSWRGAEIENILRFQKDYPQALILRLEQNYRSTAPILAAASAVIKNNGQRWDKTLWTDAQGGDSLRVVSLPEGIDEARYIVSAIETFVDAGESLSGVAILVRAAHQTQVIEEALRYAEIPHRTVGLLPFYKRQHIRDAIAYLRLVYQYADNFAFERIINVPKRGLGDTSLAHLRDIARKQGEPSLLLTILSGSVADSDLTAKAKITLVSFASMVEAWRSKAMDISLPELATIILEDSGYLNYWRDDGSEDSKKRLDDLQGLLGGLDRYDTLEDFLEHVALVMDDGKEDAAKAYVSLMTLHGAKGLEFDIVFLPGWEEGIFPSPRSLDAPASRGLEEERRLAYVGITRAKRHLIILHATQRLLYGQWQTHLPSRFIAELPEHVVVREGIMLSTPAQRPAVSLDSSAFSDSSRSSGGSRSGHSSAYHVGDAVRHRLFGDGSIVEILGDRVDVSFEDGKIRRILTSFIQKVS